MLPHCTLPCTHRISLTAIPALHCVCCSVADFQPVHSDFSLPSSLLDSALLQHGYKKLSANLYNEQFVHKPRSVAASDDDGCQCAAGDDCEENCINRAMHIECSRKCSKGDKCHNQRMARKQWADTKVFKVSAPRSAQRTAPTRWLSLLSGCSLTPPLSLEFPSCPRRADC